MKMITWTVCAFRYRRVYWSGLRFVQEINIIFKYWDCLKVLRSVICKYLVWFDFCFTALQHILGHFGRGQLAYPHCWWANLLGSLPVLSAHSFASNWQLLFLNQRKRENCHRNVFMTKSPRKNVPCRTWGSNSGPLACQADTLPIELLRPGDL